MLKSIIETTRHIYPFPDASEVFSADISRHRKHLLPLLSIDASLVNGAWSGRLHMVSPKESFDGMVGEHCPEFHTELCTNDLLAFKVDDDGRYAFMTDFQYFLTERGVKDNSPAYLAGLLEEVSEYYENVEVEFKKTRENFKNSGYLNPNSSRQSDRKDAWLMIGDEPSFYNNAAPVLKNGKKLYFVCQTNGFSYYSGGPSSLKLYFEPTEKIAVVQLDHD